MKGRFVSIDVETANSDVSSICQIGIAVFEDGQMVDQWDSLVNPECRFQGRNVMIHGISDWHVADAPKIHEIYEAMTYFLEGKQILSYGAFDRNAISKAFEEAISCQWLDATQVVRRVWEQFSHKGYSLDKVCAHLEIDLDGHHDALCDAIAAGSVFIAAGRHTNTCVDDWFSERAFDIYPLASPEYRGSRKPHASRPKFEGSPATDGHLAGHVVVFTGELSMPRIEAMTRAAEAGCVIGNGVTKKTTLVVVGQQDLKLTKGSPISSKEAKARQLLANGQPITIIGEADFVRLLSPIQADRAYPDQK